MKDLVSVIIPCYNGEHFIERSIRSVIEQNYPYIELIVIDDGSTDKSKDIILKLKKEFDNENRKLKYIFQENRGLGGAIDTGLKSVAGKYLTLLDADDRYLPDSIKEKVEFLISHSNYTGVRSNGWRICGNQRWLFVNDEIEKTSENIAPLIIEGITNNWAGSYMLRTDILFASYPDRSIYPSRYGQNIQLLFPCAYKGKFGFIDKPLMEYILQPTSLSRANHSQASKEKSLENANGYYDIRITVLKQFFNGIHSKEALFYKKLADKSLYRQIMSIAIEANNKKLMKEAFENLKALGISLDDKINYYKKVSPPYSLFFRLQRKLKSITA